MSSNQRTAFPDARIPYGTWGSSFFPAWQTSALAEVNIGQFAGESAARILGLRGVPVRRDGVPDPGLHHPLALEVLDGAAGGELHGAPHPRIPRGAGVRHGAPGGARRRPPRWSRGANDVVGVLTFDRTSDSPVGVFPERRAHERTQAIADVWDNFGFDPATGNAMITAAGITARKYKTDRSETDDVAFLRYQQYFEARGVGLPGPGPGAPGRPQRLGQAPGAHRRGQGGAPDHPRRRSGASGSWTPASPAAPRPTPPTAWPPSW